ncbi:MAG: hypothetical protein AB8G05_04840 [Oligoflexales bacterium]
MTNFRLFIFFSLICSPSIALSADHSPRYEDHGFDDLFKTPPRACENGSNENSSFEANKPSFLSTNLNDVFLMPDLDDRPNENTNILKSSLQIKTSSSRTLMEALPPEMLASGGNLFTQPLNSALEPLKPMPITNDAQLESTKPKVFGLFFELEIEDNSDNGYDPELLLINLFAEIHEEEFEDATDSISEAIELVRNETNELKVANEAYWKAKELSGYLEEIKTYISSQDQSEI